jgi:hypothetical protein
MGTDPPAGPGGESVPPWLQYPGFPPGDAFWRQTGEAWLSRVWQPFWASLGPTERDAYLVRWHAPQAWRLVYGDPDFAQWLEAVDDEESAPRPDVDGRCDGGLAPGMPG